MTNRLAAIALVCVALGAAMLVGGVYDLAGRGWALIAGAAVLCLAGGVFFRGLTNGE